MGFSRKTLNTAVESARVAGRLEGRMEMQKEMQQLLGLPSRQDIAGLKDKLEIKLCSLEHDLKELGFETKELSEQIDNIKADLM